MVTISFAYDIILHATCMHLYVQKKVESFCIFSLQPIPFCL